MPTLTEQHRRLHAFAGTWTGDEIVADSRWQKGGPATGAVTARVDLGGFFVLQDHVETRDGQVAFAVHAAFTFDEATDEVVLFWFDSYGFVPPSPARGRFVGDELVLERSSPRGRARHTYRFEDETTYSLVLESAPPEGEFAPVMRGTYRRTS